MQKACREYPAGISQRPVYMPYVKRNAAGEIVAVSALEDADHCDEVDSEDLTLRLFLHKLSSTPGLADTDLQLVRVLEDLIDLLVERSVIRFTDLPARAQEKLSARRSARVSMRSLDLLSEQDGQIL